MDVAEVMGSVKRPALFLAALVAFQRLRNRSLRPALAAAAFLGTLRLGRRLVGSRSGDGEKKMKGVAPGLVASLAACAVDPSLASPLWVLWLWVRVLRFMLPPVQHGDVLVGSVAAGINLSTYLWDHRRLGKYVSFAAKFCADWCTWQLRRTRSFWPGAAAPTTWGSR